MKRLSLILTLLWLALGANAEVFIDTIVAEDIYSADVHFRVQPRSRGTHTSELRWNVCDSATYRFARFVFDCYSASEDWDNVIDFAWGECVAGKEQKQSRTLNVSGDVLTRGCSLRLTVYEDVATVRVGVAMPIDEVAVPFDAVGPCRFMALANDGSRLLRSDVTATTIHAAQYSSFGSLEDLKAYLAESKDPYEGLWTYFDRNTDPVRAGMGGHYLVATVAADNGYDIIYIGGAEAAEASWQPLRLKGRLLTTPLPATFDLYWLQPSGLPVGDDCGAVIEGDLLTLQFPYWKAVVRLRRQTAN